VNRQNGSDDGQDYYGNNQDECNGEVYVVKEATKLRDEIQELMQQNAGIVREETTLQNGLKRILELKKQFYSNKHNIDLKEFQTDDNNNYSENIVLTWQLKSSLVACEAIIRSALMRQESRGGHYRSDFPKLDDERWKVNIYCKRAGGEASEEEMVLFKQSVKEIRGPLSDYLKSHAKAAHHRTFE
jgi:succinate dehydrogenase flavoprotein subunit